MAQIASINFKKTNPIQVRHNDRDLKPSYLLIDDIGHIEVNRNHSEAIVLKNKMIQGAMENYCRVVGQKFKAKSYEWSAVVNLKPDSTMQDLEVLAQHFQDKYGFQCYQIAIHRDEGHINEQGDQQINHHAHLEFITLDKTTGKNLFRRENITPKTLREMQSEVAKILQMERGQDKRISKTKRIEPRVYANMKENEKAIRLTLKEQKKIVEQTRKDMIKEGGYTKEHYRALNDLKKSLNVEQTRQELITAINAIKGGEVVVKEKGLLGDNLASQMIGILNEAQDTIQKQDTIISKQDSAGEQIVENELKRLQADYENKIKAVENERMLEREAIVRFKQEHNSESLQQQIHDIRTNRDEWIRTYGELQMENDRLSSELKNTQRDLSKARTELYQTSDSLMRAKKENENLLSSNTDLKECLKREQEAHAETKNALSLIPKWAFKLSQDMWRKLESLYIEITSSKQQIRKTFARSNQQSSKKSGLER